MTARLGRIPYVDGILAPEQVAETAASIVAMQEPSGAIPWTTGQHADIWNHVEAAMGLLAGGEVEAAERAYAWVPGLQREDGSWPMKIVGGGRRGRPGRGQHVGVPRRRHLAPLADPARHRVRAPVLALGPGGPGLGRVDAAAVRWRRVVPGVGRRAAGATRRGRAAGGLVEHLPVAARRRRARRPGRRPAAGVGARRRPAGARDPRAPRPVPGQGHVLDGLVLPGARWRRPRRGRPGADRDALGRLRGAGSRHQVRRHEPVGDRCGDLRAGAGARRAGGPASRDGAAARHAAPARARTGSTGPAGSTATT